MLKPTFKKVGFSFSVRIKTSDDKIIFGLVAKYKIKGVCLMKDTNSLSHTSYRCKYHIVIILKYRRLTIYNKLRRDIIEILTLLINRKPDVKIIEGEACLEHIHMLLEVPLKYAVSDFMGYLKSKSTLMIFDRHANLKYKYGSRHF